MIQDIEPHKFENRYDPIPPKPNHNVMLFSKEGILVREEQGDLSFPTFEEAHCKYEDVYEKAIYLFGIDTQRFYFYRAEDNEGLEGYCFVQRNYFRTAKPKELAFAGVTSCQLASWYQSHTYCGRCGAKMSLDTKERMLYCNECGQMEYPKICPAVIVGVTNGEKLLLTKYAGRDYKKYALVAGYTEIGETIEETVRREVKEEVGLNVKQIRYYKSQPWSFSDTLLMGFFAELDGEDTITLDQEELATAEWFKREEIPITTQQISLTNEMILYFKNEKNLFDK